MGNRPANFMTSHGACRRITPRTLVGSIITCLNTSEIDVMLVGKVICVINISDLGVFSSGRERWGNLEKEDLKENPVLRFLCTYTSYSTLMLLQYYTVSTCWIFTNIKTWHIQSQHVGLMWTQL